MGIWYRRHSGGTSGDCMRAGMLGRASGSFLRSQRITSLKVSVSCGISAGFDSNYEFWPILMPGFKTSRCLSVLVSGQYRCEFQCQHHFQSQCECAYHNLPCITAATWLGTGLYDWGWSRVRSARDLCTREVQVFGATNDVFGEYPNVASREGRGQRAEFVQYTSERPDVAFGIVRLLTPDLRTHVNRCAYLRKRAIVFTFNDLKWIQNMEHCVVNVDYMC